MILDFLLNKLNQLVNNNFIEPILIASLLSAMMGYYKSKINFKIENGILKEIFEWITSFVFSLTMVIILYLIYQIIILFLGYL